MKCLQHFSIGLLLVCLLPFAAVRAEEGQLDWSNVREENGRVVGTLELPDGLLHIDAPIPPEYTPQDAPVLKIDFQRFDMKTIEKGFKAIGVKRNKKKGPYFHADKTSAEVTYQNPKNEVLFSCEPGDAWPEYEAEMQRAEDMTAMFLAAVGIAPETVRLTAARYKPSYTPPINATEDWLERPETQAYLKRREEGWSRTAKELGRPLETLTSVQVNFTPGGLRALDWFYWPTNFSDDPGSTFGDSMHGDFNIGDDGALLGFTLRNVPVIKEETPPETLPTWREALEAGVFRTYNEGCIHGGVWIQSGQPYTNEGFTWLPIENVLTGIELCYHGEQFKTLEPIWQFHVEQRLAP